MLTQEQITEEMKKDGFIDQRALDLEIVKIPNLVQKWSDIHGDLLSQILDYDMQMDRLKLAKELYYMKKAPAEAYKAQPFNFTVTSQSAAEKWVKADKDVQALHRKKEELQILADKVDAWMKTIPYRNNGIATVLAFHQFTSGGK